MHGVVIGLPHIRCMVRKLKLICGEDLYEGAKAEEQ